MTTAIEYVAVRRKRRVRSHDADRAEPAVWQVVVSVDGDEQVWVQFFDEDFPGIVAGGFFSSDAQAAQAKTRAYDTAAHYRKAFRFVTVHGGSVDYKPGPSPD